ncbi:Importin subunit beta [Hypsibius exemplaris]|uniref:Importin subunit beta n=1 Tax=Hypsibius exemplaris TaxID=2072580 RepID=A0A9X6NE45_HYPEX|nr:Importin subunit beta [Hypsibius exemplaris]
MEQGQPMDLKNAVEYLLSPDAAAQKLAEQTLSTLLTRDFERSVVQLSEIVKAHGASDTLRQSAALAFKNAISSKDVAVKVQREAAWRAISPAARNHIKQNILSALASEHAVMGRSAAQCVACVALIELAQNEWLEVIPQLVANVENPACGSVLKQSCLETIGYICEDAIFNSISQFAAVILRALVCGMRKDELSTETRLVATSALYNSVDFFGANFQDEAKRNEIMSVVCECTQSEDSRLKVKGLQCIVRIVQCHYDFMQPYMQQALFPIAIQAMSSDTTEVVLQGLEIWCTVCDEENQLDQEAHAAKESGQVASRKSYNFIVQQLPYVAPTLLQLLTRQPDLDDADDWSPSKAAAVCLMLIAECAGAEVLPHVAPFVASNIVNTDWRFRDAACVAFGAVLEGPDETLLMEMVSQAYDFLLSMLTDPCVAVRDSAAWVISKICRSLPQLMTERVRFFKTVPVLRENLSGAPGVAANVCSALGTLVQAAFDETQRSIKATPETFAFSPIFADIMEQLFNTTIRGDSAQSNLRTAAFTAIGDFVSCAPNDCYASVQKYTVQLLEQIRGTLAKEQSLSAHERQQYGDYCQHFFTLLQLCLKRLTPVDRTQVTDATVQMCCQMLALHQAHRSLTAEPEALFCLQVLVDLHPDDFFKYLEQLNPLILFALTCHYEHSMVNAALSLVSEICCHYEASVMHLVPLYVDHIIALITQLNDPSGLVKPHAIRTLGDVALSMGQHFYPFTVKSFECLRSIAQPQDTDVWILTLDAVLDASFGLFKCLELDRSESRQSMLREGAGFIIPLMTTATGLIAEIPDGCIGNCAQLMSALFKTFGREMLPAVDRPEFHVLLDRGKQLRGTSTRKFCSLTLKELKCLKETGSGMEAVAR